MFTIPPQLELLLSPSFSGIVCKNGAVTRLIWTNETGPPLQVEDNQLHQKVRDWLQDYFSCRFRTPDFNLQPEVTPFQKRLMHRLQQIQPAQTTTYGKIAMDLNTSPRAVGRGVASNPLPLLIPCHRVVAIQGLGGFSAPGGVASKRWLLDWEKTATTNANRSLLIQ